MIIVMLGVEKGLEKASKIMMPLLFIFLLIIVAKSFNFRRCARGRAIFYNRDYMTSQCKVFYLP